METMCQGHGPSVTEAATKEECLTHRGGNLFRK